MAQFIRVNGLLMRIKRMAVEFKFGPMDPDMMASGEMEWPMGTEDLFMLKVMCMKESGQKTKLMAMEFTLILMEVDMKANGFRINNTDSVSSNGLTEPNMKDNTNKE